MGKRESTGNTPIVYKGNDLILSKYQSSLLENKLLAISMTRIEMVNDIPRATTSASEIRRLTGMESDHNLYQKLKDAAETIIKNVLILEDGKGNFTAMAFVTKAEYINQDFKLYFNQELVPYLSRIKPYTKYELANVLQLKNNYSFRLYEILKKEVFQINEQNPVVTVEYSYAELLYMLGVLGVDDVKAKKLRKQGMTWEEIQEAAGDENADAARWGRFHIRVLKKVQAELEEKTDIAFDYTGIKSGRGGKVRRIAFHIRKNDGRLPEELKEYIGHNKLTFADLAVFLKDAEEDFGKVISAIKKADTQSSIKNYVGWIRSCIREGFAEPVETIQGSAERADRVRKFMDEYEAQKSDQSSEMYINAWTKIKSRSEHFQRFLDTLALPLDLYEQFNTPKERVEEYIAWSKSGK